ncbi:hypothetical protein [Ralstonia solanacearum]|uniref:hypothetical protein n=1 Tax=Ralstonia solanacearum TaxID=305 RepID=UPI001E423010|nr:hypothetical protein [Ralstonia solanacearum]MDC6210110.1 hypothetical protein [Ralstonia solanacearum]MDD7802820.1 hypothetical protein [Ralstonia solanacearum]
MIETDVGIGVVPLSAALRHRKTMQLKIVELADAWAVRERAVIVRDLEGLPGCARPHRRADRNSAGRRRQRVSGPRAPWLQPWRASPAERLTA